jgi:hypothetical protein
MSFQEVMRLRNEGKLTAAYKLAVSDYDSAKNKSNDENEQIVWAKRALSWVYFDYLKKAVEDEAKNKTIKILKKISSLQLPSDEVMFFDQVVWKVGSIIFGIQNSEPIDYRSVSKIFELIRDFEFSRPSEGYSFLFKAFLKGYKKWDHFIEFAEWWGYENFRAGDHEKEELPNGRKIMSLVERAYIAYSKKLIESQDSDTLDETKIRNFLAKLDSVIKNPAYKYPLYYKAKLLLLLGEKANSLKALLPFARSKQNDYWVWDVMADAFPKSDDRKLACYCKALSINAPEDYLVKTRKKLAQILIDQQKFDEAKTEIEKNVSVKNEKWKISSDVQSWTDSEWYELARSLSNNKNLYQGYLHKAEEILYSDKPEEIVVVEFVNKKKKVLNFIKDKNNTGFFNYKNHLKEVETGDVLKVRLIKNGNEGYHDALRVRKADEEPNSKIIKSFDGTFKSSPNQSFGFIDDIFVDPGVVKNHKLKDGEPISGKAIISFDKKKGKWGWKVAKVTHKPAN